MPTPLTDDIGLKDVLDAAAKIAATHGSHISDSDIALSAEAARKLAEAVRAGNA